MLISPLYISCGVDVFIRLDWPLSKPLGATPANKTVDAELAAAELLCVA
ncbi:hypothetical protein PR002_g17727 [Phytophthora rubi]|uniref:Uncharacterized protein n=1 Tax=Phytophthora rubi TaxID=129364 RepID=A0A6A3K4H4_9STRA|nr:hypothetical protein PF003_g20944 [Phytophthora fragariae]KAE9002069.1 hypothetical protein PR002_g17727 [Phytophthora rubi]